MDERRLFIFLILAFVVVTVYPLLFPSAPPPQATAAPTPSASSSPVESARASEGPAPRVPLPATVEPVADASERRVEVLTREASVAFTNRGARLLSWRLTGFEGDHGRPAEMVAVVPNAPRGLDIETGDAQVDSVLRDALYKVSNENLDLSAGGEATLTFEYAAGDLAVRKAILFRGRVPLADVSVSVRRAGQELNKRLVWGPGIGVPSDAERAVRGYEPPPAVAFANHAVERLPAKKLKTGRMSIADVRWVGVESRYFVALMTGSNASAGSAEASAFDVPLPAEGETEPRAVAAMVLGDRTGPVTLYVGAKDYFYLAPLGHDFKAVVPGGEFEFRRAPQVAWKDDMNALGTADFRSTKASILWSALTAADGRGLLAVSDGRHATRAFLDKDRVGFLVADFNTGGGDMFYAGHHKTFDRPLEKGGAIKGAFRIRLIAP